MSPEMLQSHEETAKHFQGAFLRERRRVQELEKQLELTRSLFCRFVEWLRGNDLELGKWIIELRESKEKPDDR